MFKNEVVGLLGQNGTGKTTVLNILSGKLRPNLGKDTAEWDEVIQLFRGSEIQSYIKKLSKQQLKTSYKPQRIEQIPKIVSGKVKDILKKIDKTGVIDELIKEFELETILDRDITQLSGGELQRLALMVALSKQSDFLFIDEPTSFLDIKQRLKVAKTIRRFKESKSIMVVEHDIAVLDYVTDKVYILYGIPGAYGIVSIPYSTRNGINAFLNGYIKEMNIRFREEPIKFHDVSRKTMIKDVFFSYSDVKKEFNSFRLHVNSGNVFKQEVIGIIGPNGIGKTTFIKELLKITNMKFGYKPQYIETEVIEVEKFLNKKVGDYFYSSEFQRFIKWFGISDILQKNVEHLSGGELQRVYILSCFNPENKIILMDEPSAFLDVDQRLVVAKMIKQFVVKNNIVGFVVEHDLQFVDTVSDRLIVFTGEPGIVGFGSSPLEMEKGMNTLLKELGITFRRDEETNRPRPNKPGSVKDREQKSKGKYFY